MIYATVDVTRQLLILWPHTHVIGILGTRLEFQVARQQLQSLSPEELEARTFVRQSHFIPLAELGVAT